MFEKIKIGHILIVSLILRLIIAPLAEHGDVLNYYWWSKDLFERGLMGFYDRSIVNAMPPTYPPITTYVFWLTSHFHKLIWNVSWFINLKISFFPSNFIFWLESDEGWYFINKLPGILADLGISLIFYRFLKDLKSEKAGKLAAALFAFNPAFFYNSSLWGQTDSLYALPLILSFYLLYRKKYVLSILSFLLALLTKPTAFFVFLPFFVFWLKKVRLKDIYWSFVSFICVVLMLYLPFQKTNLITWIFNFYKDSLSGEIDYIVANAFNFWGLVHGFANVSERAPFLGVQSYILGCLLVFLINLSLLVIYVKRGKGEFKNLALLSVVFSYTFFMFLPRVHERYFYPSLLMLTFLASLDKRVRKVFILVSFVHLINLYHFWWVPRAKIFIELLSNILVERTLIVLNIIIYGYLLWIFGKDNVKKYK